MYRPCTVSSKRLTIYDERNRLAPERAETLFLLRMIIHSLKAAGRGIIQTISEVSCCTSKKNKKFLLMHTRLDVL